MEARALEEAELWFARRQARAGVDDEAFNHWLHATPAHAAAWEQTLALWGRLGVVVRDETLADLVDEALAPDAEEPGGIEEARPASASFRIRQRASFRRRFAYAGAAAAMIALAVVAAFGFMHRSHRAYAAGDTVRDIRLADGSRVHLDINTRLQADVGWWHRNVRLLQGRAMFDVVHDPRRPFVVDAGAGRVTVLGTRFQVDRRRDGLVVTLLRGSVRIDSPDDVFQIRLRPGEQARWQAHRGKWRKAEVDAAAVTSWAQGFQVFDATPLSKAVEEINRYSRRKLRLADPSLAGLKLSGSFRLGDASAVAEALPYVLPVKIRTEGSRIIVSRR